MIRHNLGHFKYSVQSFIFSLFLGLIEPSGSTEIMLECVPQDTALQIISGVKLTDTSLKRTYDFDNICHVYVKPKMALDGTDLKLISNAAG